MIRTFIAIDLPDDVRVAIDDAQARLKQVHVEVKISWTKVENLHLTLQFLGEVEEAVIERIKTALQSVAAQHPPFEVLVCGTGAFPDENCPRILWVGCDDPEGPVEGVGGRRAGGDAAAWIRAGAPRVFGAFDAGTDQDSASGRCVDKSPRFP